LQFVGRQLRPLRVVVDTANGAVGTIFDAVFGSLPMAFKRLCFEPDGRFPNHEPNPLKDENIQDARAAVLEFKADLAICFDGDGDRCMFLDARGQRVPSDLVTVLLARKELERAPGSAVVYDLRSSRVVAEEITKAGGRPLRERVGHAFIKATMKKNNAVLGGELSGHYYFRDHYFADSGLMAAAKVLDIVGSQPRPLEELVAPLLRYHATGEANFHVEDKAGAMERVSAAFQDGTQDRLDGITIAFPRWWCNVRASNTEPLLRLNLEADTPALRDQMKVRLLELIGGRPE
jgi:phosphomannomutase